MSTSSASFVCAVCGQSLPSAGQDCPACHASAAWQDLLEAAQFVRDRLHDWERNRLISQTQLSGIMEADSQLLQGLKLMARDGKPVPTGIGLPPRDHCWRCNAELRGSPSHCPACGVPVDAPQVRELRYWTYACTVIKSHCEARRVPLASTHACMSDAKGRIAVLRAALEKQCQPIAAVILDDGAADEPAAFGQAVRDLLGKESTSTAPPTGAPAGQPAARPAARPAVPPPQPRTPRRPLWEIVLDPRSIQWLLALGGALLVVGLVIWLATLGIFEKPWVVAVALGLGNAALLGGGWFVTLRTRYQTAGRALTLLACLVMPLNLYFYHANKLITLDGHLWAAALVCSLLYAASARVLRDRLFVYVLAGGVAMTGLLMLFHMGAFWDIKAPSTLLVALGLIFLHSERAFAPGEGAFSRQRFGLAFFWSGQALLAAGLLLLLGAQIAGDWQYEPFFKQFYQAWPADKPLIVVGSGRILALILVVTAIYAYAYSDLIVRRVGVYIYLAVFALLWAEVLVIQLLPIPLTTEVVIIALAVTALAANLFAGTTYPWSAAGRSQQSHTADAGDESLALTLQPLQRAGMPLGLALSTLPVLLGIVMHLRATLRRLAVAGGKLRLVIRRRHAGHGHRLPHRRPPLPPQHPLAVVDLHLRHRRGHAGRRRRAALDLRHQDLGQTGAGADGHPDPVCDRGAALSRTPPGKPCGVGRPGRHGRDAGGRAGGLRAPHAAAKARGRREIISFAVADLGGSGTVLPVDGRVPQARRKRLSLCGDHLPCHLGTVPLLASDAGILHAHLRSGRVRALDRLSPGPVGARQSGPARVPVRECPDVAELRGRGAA